MSPCPCSRPSWTRPITRWSRGNNQETKAKSLAASHADLKLTPRELHDIQEWVDTNLQHYGHYWGRRNTKYASHANFRPKVSFEQAIGTINPSSDP